MIQVQELTKTDQEQELASQVTDLEAKAKMIGIINNDGDYGVAAEFCKMVKQAQTTVKDYWEPMKTAAYKAHKEITSREKAMLKPLENAERILKQSMGQYITEQERIKREAEEAARKAAQAEAERKMQDAIRYEEQGDRRAAEQAMNEAAVYDGMKVTLEANKPKVDGVSVTADWRIVDIDPKTVPIEFNGVVLRPVDDSAVLKLIRQSKGNIEIPGVKFVKSERVTVRK